MNCDRTITLNVKALAKCKKSSEHVQGIEGPEGQPGKDGKDGVDGKLGLPGPQGPYRHCKMYTNRWTGANMMAKNIASADPDRVLTTLYNTNPPVHIRCWRMLPSFETQEPIGYPSEIVEDAGSSEPAETTFHCIATHQGFPPGWVQIRTTIDINQDDALIGPNFFTSYLTNEVYVEEPPPDRGRHIRLTTIRPSRSGIPHSRVFPQTTRTKPSKGPEYEGEIFLEAINIRNIQLFFDE
jgi:hypothetical protein